MKEGKAKLSLSSSSNAGRSTLPKIPTHSRHYTINVCSNSHALDRRLFFYYSLKKLFFLNHLVIFFKMMKSSLFIFLLLFARTDRPRPWLRIVTAIPLPLTFLSLSVTAAAGVYVCLKSTYQGVCSTFTFNYLFFVFIFYSVLLFFISLFFLRKKRN